MYDKPFVKSVLEQIDDALQTIKKRTEMVQGVNDFTDTPAGMEKLDSVCMLFMAIGDALKKIDRITKGSLLSKYPEIDWKGAIGFRDIIAHHYFDIDAEQVFWICEKELAPLSTTVKKMLKSFN